MLREGERGSLTPTPVRGLPVRLLSLTLTPGLLLPLWLRGLSIHV